MDLFDISGRTAIVTGGTSGIGLMIARGFVEAGAGTYITSRTLESAQGVAAELAAGGGHCEGLAADLSTNAGVKAFAADVTARLGHVDILINNAGSQWDQPIDDFSEEGWDSVVDLNLKSVFFLTQAMLPLLRKAASADRPARVINIGSIGGLHVSFIENYSYSAAKAGLHHLTRALSKRLARDHITVNTIAPGSFPSKMMDQTTPEFRAKIAAATPLGRIGRPEDLAGTAIYLSSMAGAYVTGTVLAVDGGVIAAL